MKLLANWKVLRSTSLAWLIVVPFNYVAQANDSLSSSRACKIVAITLYSELNSTRVVHEHELILAVIRNRTDKKRLTVADVCVAKYQFSWWNRFWINDRFNASQTAIDAAYTKIPDQFIKDLQHKLFRQNKLQPIDHFYSPKSMKPANKVPYWAKGRKPVYETKNFKFYLLNH